MQKVRENGFLLYQFPCSRLLPVVWGWLGCLTKCLAQKLWVLFIYMEMDLKRGSELTGLNTSLAPSSSQVQIPN